MTKRGRSELTSLALFEMILYGKFQKRNSEVDHKHPPFRSSTVVVL